MIIDVELRRLHERRRAVENKIYTDTNGDRYIGRGGLLMFVGLSTRKVIPNASNTSGDVVTNTIITQDNTCCEETKEILEDNKNVLSEINTNLEEIAEDTSLIAMAMDDSLKTPIHAKVTNLETIEEELEDVNTNLETIEADLDNVNTTLDSIETHTINIDNDLNTVITSLDSIDSNITTLAEDERDNLTQDQLNEELQPLVEDLDLLSQAMDKANRAPLYVEDINGPPRKDSLGALSISDAADTFNFRGALPINGILMEFDTTGFQSAVIQVVSNPGSITVSGSNDRINWVAVNGYAVASSTLTGSPVLSSASGIFQFPAAGKYMRLTGSAAGSYNVTTYLRQQITPNGSYLSLPSNINYLSNSSLLAVVNSLSATLSPTINQPALPIGGSVAPGSTTVPYPVVVGGQEVAAVGSLAGKVRPLRTDSNGRLVLSSDDPSTPIYVKDAGPNQTTDGFSTAEILLQVLAELKALNITMQELPALLTKNLTTGQPNGFPEDYSYLRDELLKTNI